MNPTASLTLLLAAVAILPAARAEMTAREVPDDTPLTVRREDDAFAIAEQMYAQSRAQGIAEMEKRGLLEQAEGLFANFALRYPSSPLRPKAMYYRATCLMELGQANKANVVLAEVATRTKGDIAAAAAYKLGAQCTVQHEWEKARQYYAITYAQSMNRELRNDARYRMARAMAELGDAKGAEAIYQELVAAPGLSGQLRAASLLALAAQAARDGREENAYRSYTLLLGQDDIDLATRSTATLQAARLASRLGKNSEAQELYSRLANMPGMESYAAEAELESLLMLYRDKKYQEVALRASSHGAELQDPKMEARRCLVIGQSYYELKQFEPAMRYFAAAERSDPHGSAALEASYRALVSAAESHSGNFMAMAQKHLNTYAGAAPTADNPVNDLVRLMYAERLMLVDAAEAARQYGSIRLEKLPENLRPDAAFKTAWSLVQAQSPDALGKLDAFIANYPKDKRVPEAYLLRGLAYHAIGKDDLALADFDKVISEYPKSDSAPLAWQRAAQVVTGKDASRMIYYYEGLISRFPGIKPAALAEAHYAVARAYYEKKEGAKAVPHFKEARTLNPDQYGPLVDANLVHCYYMMQDLEQLRIAMEKLEKENKATFDALPLPIPTWLGWTSFQKKDYAAADKYLSLVVARAEDKMLPAAAGRPPVKGKNIEASVWKALAKSRLVLGKYFTGNQAIDQYLAVEAQPYRRVEGMKDKAELLLGMEKPADARKVAEEAISLGIDGPLKSALYIVLGDTYFAEKNYAEAAKNYGRVANVISDPELKPMALFKLVATLKKEHKAEEAALYENMLRDEFSTWQPDARLRLMTE